MRLIQVALHAEDLDRAADFYTVLLESPPSARFDPPGLLFFDLDGVRLLLDRNAPSSLLYLHVEQRPRDAGALRRARRCRRPTRTSSSRHEDDTLGPAGHDEWQAFIQDSEGNTVGLIAFQRADESRRRA